MSGTGVFQERETQLVFNDYLPSITSPWIALERSADNICASSNAVVSGMQRIDGVGWQIRSYMRDPGDIAWLSPAQAGALSVGNGATVAPHFVEEDSFIQPSLSGVSYAGSVVTSGGPVITAKIPAGTDRSTLVLTADQAAFPSPDTSDDPVTMDRVHVFDGTEPWDAILFQFYAPSSALTSRGTFGTGYFNGPAGVDSAGAADSSKRGTGHYAMKIRGDSTVAVWEVLADGTWKYRYAFPWREGSNAVEFGYICITVIPRMWQDGDGNYLGDRITFQVSSLTSISVGAGIANTVADLLANQTGNQKIYNVPRQVKVPTVDCPIRVDLARDCRATFMPYRHIYRDSGILIDDYFALDQAINTSENFNVYLQGVIPAGTTVAIELFDEDGASLSPATSQSVINTQIGQTAYRAFVPVDRMRFVRMKVTATSDSGHTRTPTLIHYAIYRSPEYNSENPLELVTVPSREAPPALPRTTIESFAITPQETDPGAESAVFVVTDLVGDLEFLGERNMIPILCRTRYDSNPDHWADLFRGYILQATGEVFRRDDRDGGGTGTAGYKNGKARLYPAGTATRYTLQCVGEWARAAETLTPKLKTWGTDEATGELFRATDVIRFNAELIYPAELVDVPDLDIPLNSADPSAFQQEPNTKCIDTMQGMATDYAGGYMLFDEAAGEKGILRMLLQKHAPYNNLAVFEMDHPTKLAGDSVPRLPHWAGAYQPTTEGDQEVLHTFIVGGTYAHWLEKAEGNAVIVHGAAIGADTNTAGNGPLLCQTAVNVGSYNFLGLSPGDDGYPDGSSPEFYNRIVPIRDTNFNLGTQEAVDWKCRRIFEKACFARFYLGFEAPMLLVTDTTDALQQRPRRLRFYDPVQVRKPDGTLAQFLVVSCTPTAKKDGEQMARYVLVTQSNIDTIGVIDKQSSDLLAFLKAFGRATGTNWTFSPPLSSQGRQGEHLQSKLLALPSPTSAPIQELDPTSADFGKFINMASYEAIPHA